MQTKPSKSTARFALCAAAVAMLVASPFTSAHARWIEKPSPRLPYGVFIEGAQGSVVLSMTLDRSGRVTGTQVIRSSGYASLDGLAESAAKGWRLSPDSVVATDLTQGRVELVKFVHLPPPVRTLLPGSQPYWAEVALNSRR